MVRGIEADVLPTARAARHGHPHLQSLSAAVGCPAAGAQGSAATPTSAARPKARFDMTTEANQRKLEIAESLAQLAEQQGLSLIDLAIAFVINHPAVTAAIIGPRTMEQLESQLTGAERHPGAARPWTASTNSSPPGRHRQPRRQQLRGSRTHPNRQTQNLKPRRVHSEEREPTFPRTSVDDRARWLIVEWQCGAHGRAGAGFTRDDQGAVAGLDPIQQPR